MEPTLIWQENPDVIFVPKIKIEVYSLKLAMSVSLLLCKVSLIELLYNGNIWRKVR